MVYTSFEFYLPRLAGFTIAGFCAGLLVSIYIGGFASILVFTLLGLIVGFVVCLCESINQNRTLQENVTKLLGSMREHSNG